MKRHALFTILIALTIAYSTVSVSNAQLPDPPGQVRDGAHPENEAYLFAHMVQGDYGRLYYSVSLDGLHWEMLNGRQRINDEYRGHADICRGHDGRYYLVGNLNDKSPDINFWVSDDLVRWEKYADYRPDLKRVPDFPKTMQRIGAPKLCYNEGTGEGDAQYLLTWHTTHFLGETDLPEPYWAGQRTLYATSKDLKTFSDPPRMLFPPGEEMATIDTIVRKDGDRYYAIFKDERYPTLKWSTGKTIRIRSADSLLGPYGEPETPISPGFREAPTLIRSPDGSVWYLYYEQYPGVGYGLSVAETLAGPWHQISGGTSYRDWDKFALPEGARHGSMLTITRNQYDTLIEAFGKE